MVCTGATADDHPANTLILNGTTIDCSADTNIGFAVAMPNGGKIFATGNNTVKGGTNTRNGNMTSFAIVGKNEGTLEIGGDGTLTAISANVSCAGMATSRAIIVPAGDITLTGSVQITATSGSAVTTDAEEMALCAGIGGQTLTLNNSVTVTATGGSATSAASDLECAESDGVSANTTVNGGSLTANGGASSVGGGSESGLAYGISSMLTVNGGSVTATGNTKAVGRKVSVAVSGTVKKGANAGNVTSTVSTSATASTVAEKYIHVTFGPSIAVGAQTDAKPVRGAGGDADYTVTLSNFGGSYPNFSGNIEWVGATPVSASGFEQLSENEWLLNIEAFPTTTEAGVYTFKVTSPKNPATDGNYESAEVTFIVHENLTDVGYSIKDGKLTDATANMEYQLNSGAWTACTAGDISGFTFNAGDVLKVRDKNDTTHERTVVTVPAAPVAPTASGVTYSVKNGTVSNLGTTYEWSNDGGATWQTTASSITFTAGTITVRTKAIDTALPSAAATLGTIAPAAAAPAAPSIGTGVDKPTAGKITFTQLEGKEYFYSTSATPPTEWKGAGFVASTAGNWSTTLTDLTAATQYYIHVRTAATDEAFASACASVSQYTAYETPTSAAYSINAADSNKVTFASEYEVNTASTFDGTSVASGTGLTSGDTYYIRHRAGTGDGGLTIPASAPLSFVCAKAEVSAFSVRGVKNSAVTPVTGVIVTLTGETFNDTALGSAFTTNAAGLYATVTAVAADKKSCTVTISGTPTTAVLHSLTINLPAGVLTGGAQLTTAANTDAEARIKTDVPLQRREPLDFTRRIVYQNEYGRPVEMAPDRNITDSGEGWAWYVGGTVTVDGTTYAATRGAPVLVLKGLTLERAATRLVNLPNAAVTVVLQDGTVTTLHNTAAFSSTNDVLHAAGPLTVTGTGTVDVAAGTCTADKSYGIYCGSTLNITGAPAIATGGNYAYGVYAAGSITATGTDATHKVTLTVTGGVSDACALYSGADVALRYADVKIGADNARLPGVGIRAVHDLLMKDSTVDIYGDNSTIAADSGSVTFENDVLNLYTAAVNSNVWGESGISVSGSTVNTYGGYDGLGSCGGVTIIDSHVSCLPLTGHESRTTAGIAIEDGGSGDITITNSTVTAKSGDSAAAGVYGLYNADGSILFTGSTVVATAGSTSHGSGYSCGICAVDGDITVTGGSVSATAGSATANSLGVSADNGKIVVNSGALSGVAGTSTSTGANNGSFGLYAYGDIEVEAGSVTGTAENANSVGLLSMAKIVVNGGAVTGTGKTVSMAGGDIVLANTLAITAPLGAKVETVSGRKVIVINTAPALTATIGAKPASSGSYTPPSITAKASTLTSSALAIGSAIKNDTAKLTPAAGYTMADIRQMQANSELELVTSYVSGYPETADDAAALSKAMGSSLAAGTYPMYINITLQLRNTRTGAIVATVDSTDKAVTFTVELDDALRQAVKNGAKIVVLRAHGGKVTKLPTTLSADKTQVSFVSSLFSSYAVVATSGNVTSVNTGDSFFLALWTGLVIMSVLGLGYVVCRKRRQG